MNRIVKGIIVLLVLSFVVIHLVKYFSMYYDARQTLKVGVCVKTENVDDPIDVLGIMDSYGVPYAATVENSFLDYLTQELKNQNRCGQILDLYNLYINKTWHVNGIFCNGVTIGEMIRLKNFSLDFTRYKYPKKIKTSLSYECSSDMENVSVYDYTSQMQHPVILYSCSANDLFYYFGFSVEGLTPQRIVELLSNVDTGLELMEAGIRSNMETLLSCNSRSQIFVMGLYVPSDNFFVYNAGSYVVGKINRTIKKICDEFDNVYYVDVSCVASSVLKDDFHPNSDGQKIIATKLAQSISTNLKPFENINYKKGSTQYVEEWDNQLTAEQLSQKVNECDLPKRDYVEWTTAFEWALMELKCENISYICMVNEKEKFMDMYRNDEHYADIEKAYDIVLTEHKILYGISEYMYALHPEQKKNDKLGLIHYYH